VIAGPDQVGMQGKLQRVAEQAGIAGRVYWPGSIDGDLKWGALRACDAFVLSSHSENFGIAVVESLAVGRPVLISNQVNIWPEIERDKAGLVDDDTLEGTERLLRRWFDLSPGKRDAIAARTRLCFQTHFTMNRTTLAIDRVFSSATPLAGKVNGADHVSNDGDFSVSPPQESGGEERRESPEAQSLRLSPLSSERRQF
jgi:glycosyltransferase involved in cell wall biosynthesis